MDSINGLPAHPLFVHAPVVLVPLATLLAIVMAARPELRRRNGWALAIAATVGLVATQLAVSSGYEFDELVRGIVNTDRHQSLGETTRNFVAVFTVAAVVTAILDRRSPERTVSATQWGTWLSMAVTTVSGVLATVWMVRTGDEGARLVWDGVLGALPF